MTGHPRHPRSSAYDLAWLLGLDMGPNPLWQLEDLLTGVELAPGDRVLDLGCGRGATSVFLAREFGVAVTAVDLWVPEAELRATVEAAGVADRVTVLNADARALPFDDEAFDAVVSIDAFEYFGTDARFLPGLLRVVRPGGWIGMTTPALRPDPYQQPPPAAVVAAVGWEVAAWHAPEWWVTHWSLTGLIKKVEARMQDGGREDWLRWCRAAGEAEDSPVVTMLRSCSDDELGIAAVSATKRGRREGGVL